jgi:cyanate lyase
LYSQNPSNYGQHYYPYVQGANYPIADLCKYREGVTCLLLVAKHNQGLTFEQIAKHLGGSKEWAAAAILGQASMNKEDALRLTSLLNVDPRIAGVLQEPPMRGSIDRTIPVDPLIYRFYEIMQVYGTTFKALINEMFGDGIVSAIDLKIGVDRRPDPEDPEGERVVITLDGKFLPYEKW